MALQKCLIPRLSFLLSKAQMLMIMVNNSVAEKYAVKSASSKSMSWEGSSTGSFVISTENLVGKVTYNVNDHSKHTFYRALIHAEVDGYLTVDWILAKITVPIWTCNSLLTTASICNQAYISRCRPKKPLNSSFFAPLHKKWTRLFLRVKCPLSPFTIWIRNPRSLFCRKFELKIRW